LGVDHQNGDNSFRSIVLCLLGILLQDNDRRQESVTAFQAATALGSQSAYRYLGEMAEKDGELTAARRWYGLGARSDRTDCYAGLVRVSAKLGDSVGLESASAKVLQLGSQDEVIWLAEDLFEDGHGDAAMSLLRNAIQHGNTRAPTALGRMLIDAGGPDEAAFTVLRQGTAMGDGDAAVILGIQLHRVGDVAGAEAAFREGSTLGSAIAVFNLGVLLADQRRYAEAEQAYRRAIELRVKGAEEALQSLQDERASQAAEDAGTAGEDAGAPATG
jgi:tetratricopeptide (TPR) repeat protein